jgi:hypothetical protein
MQKKEFMSISIFIDSLHTYIIACCFVMDVKVRRRQSILFSVAHEVMNNFNPVAFLILIP